MSTLALSGSPAGSVPRAADPAIIEARGVTKVFRRPDGSGFLALKDVDLTIGRGRFVCLVGPSGCGKSTFVNMLAGLIAPTAGTVTYDGRVLKGVNTSVGYITQSDTLLPWATVRRNVSLALEIRKQGTRAERRKEVDAALAVVGLTEFADHYPAQLSGGMRKRAILARSWVYDPETLLLDEPFGALDAQLKMSLQRRLLQMWETHRRTVVFVTHDLEEALLLADDIVVFGRDPGRIVHVEHVDLPRPRDLFELRTSPAFGARWRALYEVMADAAGASDDEEAG